jgi:hypothetical protein
MTPASHTSAVSERLVTASTGAAAPAPALPRWARLFLPSLADIVFVSLLFAAFGALGPTLLGDADIGWHIRNGDHILATHSVPRTDYFSYTMAGRPWYAWEWLYDIIVSKTHSRAGLDGVVLLSSFFGALTFAWMFRLALRLSGNFVVAGGLTLLSAVAASIHLLARPHLLTWLLTLVCFEQISSYQRGERRHLFLVPALMPVWVNLHGGFLVGIALLPLVIAANLWTRCTASAPESRGRAQERLQHLSLILPLTLIATLLNPYGYRLYVHLYGYLADRFLMDNISEFLSPDFHLAQVKAFALLLIATLVALAVNKNRPGPFEVLVLGFSAWIGLYSTRNIPIASILLTLTAAPILGGAIRELMHDNGRVAWLRNLAAKSEGFSTRIIATDLRLKGHAFAAFATVTLLMVGLRPGRTELTFDAKKMPVQAAEYMAAHNIRGHFLSPDGWGGYLIYRLYPDVRMMMDDRHDFYGRAYVRDYMKTVRSGFGWRELLDAKAVDWVLVPPDYPLANTLKAVPDWKVIYDDGTAIIFARAGPMSTPSAALAGPD